MVHLRAGRDTTYEVSPYAEEIGETGVVHPLNTAEWRIGPLTVVVPPGQSPSRCRSMDN
jgi:hypothetical protein